MKKDFTKSFFLLENQIIINVHVINEIKGRSLPADIQIVINKEYLDSLKNVIDLASLKSNQQVLLLLKKSGENYYFENNNSWLIWPNSFASTVSNPAELIKSLLASRAQDTYKNDFELLIRNSLSKFSFDSAYDTKIIATYSRIYNDQYLMIKQAFGENINALMAVKALDEIDKLGDNSPYFPNEDSFLEEHANSEVLNIFLKAYSSNRLSDLKLKKLDSMCGDIISKLPPSVVRDNFKEIVNSGANSALVAALDVLSRDVNQLPLKTYLNCYLNSKDSSVKYHAFQCIVDACDINQKIPDNDDFKKILNCTSVCGHL